MRTILHRAALGATLAAALTIATSAPVSAHAELVSAVPGVNGSVAEAPDRLVLTFSERLDPDRVTVEVLDVLGRPIGGVGAPSVHADGRTVEVRVTALAAGVFTVAYEAVSLVDGHATRGTYAFLVDPTGAAPPPADSARSTSPSVDAWTVTARWVGLAGLLIALGSLAMWWNAGREVLGEAGLDTRPPWRLMAGAAAVGAAGVIAYLLLAARPLPSTGVGLDPAAAFGWTPFAIAMRASILAALAAAALGFVGRATPDAGHPLAAAVLLGIALAGMSLAGHVASNGGPAFAALDWLHLVAAAAWLGALPAAWTLAARAGPGRRSTAGRMLRLHGRLALVAAPLVVLSGLANSPLVLGAGRNLVASDYGNLLLAKAVLLSAALAIGAVNHLALRGRGRSATGALVTAELVVAALAVMTAATMVTIQPASARAPIVHPPPVAPAHFFEQSATARVHVAVSLPAPGNQAYRVTVRDAERPGSTAGLSAVLLTFTPPPASGLRPERVELTADPAGGLWTASGAHTPVPGTWGLEVTLRRPGEPDERAAFDLDVLPLDAPETGPPSGTGLTVPAPLVTAWNGLPPGPAGWLPAIIGVVVLALLGHAPRGPVRGIGRSAALVVVLLAGAGAAGRSLVDAANAPSVSELAAQAPVAGGDPARGREIFEANCAVCHGTRTGTGEASGGLAGAGSLESGVRSSSDAELSYRIAYGVAGTAMPPFAGRLTAAERSDLICYLRDRFGGR